MKKKQVKKKQRSLAADIQTVLLWVLRGISFFYLIMMGVVMPFYYHPETSYMTIGSGKAEFTINGHSARQKQRECYFFFIC